jgi:hypothetical protein
MEWYNIAILILGIIVVIITMIFYLKDKSLSEIKKDVYGLFVDAEHEFEPGEGKQKMEWVVSKARLLLPKWLQLIISDEMLERLIELWFQAIKALLHDGKEHKGEAKNEG